MSNVYVLFSLYFFCMIFNCQFSAFVIVWSRFREVICNSLSNFHNSFFHNHSFPGNDEKRFPWKKTQGKTHRIFSIGHSPASQVLSIYCPIQVGNIKLFSFFQAYVGKYIKRLSFSLLSFFPCNILTALHLLHFISIVKSPDT